MKKTIIFSLLLIKSIFSLAQSKGDTIYVNTKQTTYVVCKDSIDWFEVGNKEYAGKIMGTTFFLKPTKANASTTSLLIKSGESHIYKTVVYSDNLSKTLYDLRDYEGQQKHSFPKSASKIVEIPKDRSTDSEGDKEPQIKRQPKEHYQNALQKFLEIADPFKSIAVSKDRIVLSLGNAKTQGDEVFLKYNISNYSGHRFNMDEIELIFVNQSGHLLGSNTAFDTTIDPIVEHTLKFVDPSQRGVIGFVVPLEQLNTKGKVFIRIKENPGKKLLALEVPTTIFQKSN